MDRTRPRRSRLLVLTWHNVTPTWCFPSAEGRGRTGLAAQLDLCRHVANVIPLDEAVTALAEGRALPPRAVALTFDDGYRDALDEVAPLLERRGLPATFFLVPGLLSGTASPWWEVAAWALRAATTDSLTFGTARFSLANHRERAVAAYQVGEWLKRRCAADRAVALSELRERCRPSGHAPGEELFLDWDGAKKLAERGFAVGSHSMSHHILAEEDADSQAADLTSSRRELERRLSVPVRQLAYPNGKRADYNAATLTAVREAGYTGSFTTIAGRNTSATPPGELRRFVVSPARGPAGLALMPAQTLRGEARPRHARHDNEQE